MPRKGGYGSAEVGWRIAKDAVLPLKYGALVYTVTAYHVCSKQRPRQLPNVDGVMH